MLGKTEDRGSVVAGLVDYTASRGRPDAGRGLPARPHAPLWYRPPFSAPQDSLARVAVRHGKVWPDSISGFEVSLRDHGTAVIAQAMRG